ncbi:hypothetical protein BASA83_007606 [Batrachochytrium salamandrivorans]|nr:hypothetical protein BASA83_007606 [Batrachochytrium salamandrivorans]
MAEQITDLESVCTNRLAAITAEKDTLWQDLCSTTAKLESERDNLAQMLSKTQTSLTLALAQIDRLVTLSGNAVVEEINTDKGKTVNLCEITDAAKVLLTSVHEIHLQAKDETIRQLTKENSRIFQQMLKDRHVYDEQLALLRVSNDPVNEDLQSTPTQSDLLQQPKPQQHILFRQTVALDNTGHQPYVTTAASHDPNFCRLDNTAPVLVMQSDVAIEEEEVTQQTDCESIHSGDNDSEFAVTPRKRGRVDIGLSHGRSPQRSPTHSDQIDKTHSSLPYTNCMVTSPFISAMGRESEVAETSEELSDSDESRTHQTPTKPGPDQGTDRASSRSKMACSSTAHTPIHTPAVVVLGDKSINLPSTKKPIPHTPNFAYEEVVRDKERRKQMHGEACPCCEGYYRITADLSTPANLNENRISQQGVQGRIQASSRHRFWSARPKTPPGFWRVDFPSTQENRKDNLKSDNQTKRLDVKAADKTPTPIYRG